MKMKTYSRKLTHKDKLKDLTENRRIDESLAKHYTFILEHFDEIIAAHDKDIAIIDEKKTEVLKQFIEAPQKLATLNQHLAELQKRCKTVKDTATGKTQKIKRVKNLRERLAALEEECKTEGINIEDMIKDLG